MACNSKTQSPRWRFFHARHRHHRPLPTGIHPIPRKLLHIVGGRPLILHTAERIRTQAPELPLHFAVDDDLLAAPLLDAGFSVIRTGRQHPNGTDRIAEANRTVRADHVINVQADEPLVTGAQIRRLAQLIAGPAAMATLATPFKTAADFANPNQVKVVFAPAGDRALYFSRSPIPYCRDLAGQVDDAWVRANPCYRHLGLYAYKAALLDRLASLPPDVTSNSKNSNNSASSKTATTSPATSLRTRPSAWTHPRMR